MRVVTRSAACAALCGLYAARAFASPMSALATKLACEGAEQAELALEALTAAPATPFGVPDESLTGTDDRLRAAAIDDLLDALANARQRFPELSTRIDALVASWDFCALTGQEARWDLLLGDELLRRAPATLSPLASQGFAAWGLLPRTARGRPLWNAARAALPATHPPQCQRSALPSLTPHGPMPVLPPPEPALDATCERPPPPVEPVTEVPPPPPLAAPRARAATPSPRSRGRATPGDVASPEAASSATRDELSPLPGTLSANATFALSGGLSTGIGVSLAPLPNTFVRGGASWRAMSRWEEDLSLEPTWSWGLGYDNWRTGTLSVQLNHWGPLRRWPGTSALRGAVLAIGYKIPLGARLGKVLSARVDLTSPLSWAPALGVGVSAKLPFHCFVSVGASQRLDASAGPTWTYTLGHSQWKPGTLSLILANYGPNELGALNPRNLTLTASWSWRL